MCSASCMAFPSAISCSRNAWSLIKASRSGTGVRCSFCQLSLFERRLNKIKVFSPDKNPAARGCVVPVTLSPAARIESMAGWYALSPFSPGSQGALKSMWVPAASSCLCMIRISSSNGCASITLCIMPPAAPTSLAIATSSSSGAKVPGMQRPSGSRWAFNRFTENPIAPSLTDFPASLAI